MRWTPLALLERIINASSNPNDIVLDAFCGCGTAGPPSDAAGDLFEIGVTSDRERERRLQLAVTKQLVERHAGAIEVESGLHGTHVLVAFPAADPDGGVA